ncbi:uncharacterized protein LOC128559239 [Mercenaria mercenaria]|uniref:uncharacterized protein LOC128559239 n=1 Tax=Mercenaria mercenaria TaxID=6596 RepID=UPI00234EDDCC|nr:uncharacterized protein LOC128559239 [Mercenaria mercenaria]
MSGTHLPGLSTRLKASADTRVRVVEIASSHSPNQVPSPDIEDDQKRWLIVGICLHSVVSPALRQYIPPVVSKLYSNLQQSDQIHTQTYTNYLKQYRTTNKELNYEAINNNAAIPKVRGKKDVQRYDYRVTSAVDLTKLFMQTHMAHYTGFDDTCDSSALLGIIINIDSFPNLIKQVSEKVVFSLFRGAVLGLALVRKPTQQNETNKTKLTITKDRT